MNHKTDLSTIDLDLDINNYTLKDLYNLFQINSDLEEEQMKNAKKIVLKMHPDKSNLDAKYFLFFSTAYKKLYQIYEFQNKISKKSVDTREFYDKDKKTVLDSLFENNKKLKESDNFNKWFNDLFEKHKVEDTLSDGYGNWLKSDEGIFNTTSISNNSLNEEFEKHKQQVKTITVYNGITDPFSSCLGGSILGKTDNFSSGVFDSGALSYQDIKQAHLETIIPITNDDYKNIKKFSSEQEYKLFRDNQNLSPLDEKNALSKLREDSNKLNMESANLAYYYAKQSEESKKQNNIFWSKLHQLSNGP